MLVFCEDPTTVDSDILLRTLFSALQYRLILRTGSKSNVLQSKLSRKKVYAMS
jgi:hypothetical protein